MAGMQKIQIIGNLGRDPETRYTPDGLTVTNFSVAVTEKVKGKEVTTWWKCIAFGKLGDISGEYLQKGKQVYIEGRPQTSEWEDRDGNKRFNLEIVANTMLMLGGRESRDGGNQASETPSDFKPGMVTPSSDTIPF